MSPEPRRSSRCRWIALLASVVAACATPPRTPDGRPVEIVSAAPPGCRLLGDVVGEHAGFLCGRNPVGEQSNRLAAQDVLLDVAARKGATHVVVTSTDYYGTNLTDAVMRGKAYQCP